MLIARGPQTQNRAFTKPLDTMLHNKLKLFPEQMDKKPNKYLAFLIYAALALATFAAFEQTCRNGFVVLDDPAYVTENPHVKAGITRKSLIWAFTSPHSGNWHSLTWLSHMLDCELFGLNPFWHHLTSLLLHIANTLLLFWVLKKMTGTLWPAAFVAAAFALHPLHVESVAWIAERKDVLSGFFWILTMAAYIRYAEQPGPGRYLLVLLALCLGLMAKPMLVTLPFVLLLLDYWPLGRLRWPIQKVRHASEQQKTSMASLQSSLTPLIIEKIPLFVIVAVASVITFIVQQNAGAMPLAKNLPLNIRVANALVSYLSYIVKMFYPVHLAVFYPYPKALYLNRAVIFLVLISVFALLWIRQRPWMIVGWLWYLGTLVPVIGLVQVGNQALADRYTYIPLIGLFIIVAWGAPELLAKWRYQRIGLGISVGIVVAAMIVCTRLQVSHWQNDITLFGHAVKVTENNFIIHHIYGDMLFRKNRFDEAIIQFNEALRINPNDYEAHNGMGKALLKQGKIEKAVAHLAEALRLKPDDPRTIHSWGLALMAQGNLDEAIVYFNKVLRTENWPDVYCNLGLIYTQRRKYDLAIQNYNEALRIDPDFVPAHEGLERTLLQQSNFKQAIRE